MATFVILRRVPSSGDALGEGAAPSTPQVQQRGSLAPSAHREMRPSLFVDVILRCTCPHSHDMHWYQHIQRMILGFSGALSLPLSHTVYLYNLASLCLNSPSLSKAPSIHSTHSPTLSMSIAQPSQLASNLIISPSPLAPTRNSPSRTLTHV